MEDEGSEDDFEASLPLEDLSSDQLQAGLSLGEPDIYSSVTASALGGVQVILSHGDAIKLHPIALFLLCIPVFLAQISIVLFLRFDLITAVPHFEDQGLLELKLLLVIITYLMSSQKFLQTVQHIVVLLNPLTWVEVEHASPADWAGEYEAFRFLFKPSFLAPWSVLAAVMNFVVTYIVCADSVSIILSSENAKDAIFNSLAITFISDLAMHWWQLCAYFLHLSSLDDFRLVLKQPHKVWVPQTEELTREAQSHLTWTIIPVVMRWTRCPCLGIKHSFLRMGYGARPLTRICSVSVLGYVYARQLCIVMHAVDTHTLPVLRDLCAESDLQVRDGILNHLWRAFSHLLFVSRVERLEWDDDLICTAEQQRINLDIIVKQILPHHPATFAKFAVVLAVLMIAPTLGHIVHAVLYIRNRTPRDASVRREPDDFGQRIEQMSRDWQDLTCEMQALRARLDSEQRPLPRRCTNDSDSSAVDGSDTEGTGICG